MDAPAEAELLARCQRGEADAWNELFDLHYAATARFIFQLGPELSREDVEELCQETFLTVIKRLATFHGSSRFQTWLFRIAANKVYDQRQRHHATKRGGGQTTVSLDAPDPVTELTLDPPSEAPAPDAELLSAECLSQLRTALDELGDPCRETLELRYFGDLSYEEIAVTLKVNPKTVSSRLSKCLDRLEEIARAIFAGGKSRLFPV